MKKYKNIEEFLDDLDDTKRMQVDALRELIQKTEPQLEEHIKWNAPSYVFKGKDRVSFNLMNKQEVVKLILHMDTARKENKRGVPIMQDESGLIEWSSDIRGIITFEKNEDIDIKSASLRRIIKEWISIPTLT